MRGKVLDHVTLDVAADHAHVFLALDLEVPEGRQKAACFQLLEQDVERHLDRQGIGLATIDDTGNVTVATRLTSGALACPRACFGVKIRNLTSHVEYSKR